MKKLLFVFSMIFFVMLSHGQIPKKFNYQAVVRNEDGTLKKNSPVNATFRIYEMGSGGTQVHQENFSLTSDNYGMISAIIGDLQEITTSWDKPPYSLEVSIDGNLIGTTQIQSVPFALMAADVVNKDDADADPANELQDLEYTDNILKITGNPDATPIIISGAGDSQWTLQADSVTILDKNIGIGTTSPTGRLVIMGDGTEEETEPLFEVKKADGQTVFAVYNDGAEVIVASGQEAGLKSGFTVGSPNELGTVNDYLLVRPDSVRVYVNDPSKKGIKGGFAVGGYNKNKAGAINFMSLEPDNYYIGHQSGLNTTTGIYNSTLGYQAGASITSGSENIFIGYQSGNANTDGYQNTFMGYLAGSSNTSGNQNSFLGYRAGHDNTTGNWNLFLGHEAGLSNTIGNQNTFLGYRAGASNTSGESNMFIGTNAGINNTIGTANLFVGPGAGFENVDGNRNTFFGHLSGYYNTSGSGNLFLGEYSGYTNTTGTGNIFIGTSTGSSNISGHTNIFIGNESGYLNTTGVQNTMLGYQTGFNLVEGAQNVFLGFEAGHNTKGSNNVYLGARAGSSTVGSGNIFIGNGAAGSETSLSNTLVIDNSYGKTAENALISGKMDDTRHVKIMARFGIWRIPEVNRLELEGSASKSTAGDWLANSDMRIKTEIEDIEDAYEVMLKLRPVKYRYTEEYMMAHPDIADRDYYNFLAQEYQKVFPESVHSSGEILESANDEILQMDSYNAQIYSIKAVQELIKENQQQKKQIEELYEMIRELQNQ